MLLRGKYNEALIYTDNVDEGCQAQILRMLNSKPFAECQIRIMPDVHKGVGSTIGFTMTLTKYVIPNIVGVDIGCGVLAYNLGKLDFSFEKLDNFVRRDIPHGFYNREQIYHSLENDFKKSVEDVSKRIGLEYAKAIRGVGSLGGGNHFIEIGQQGQNTWLIIHSGSRNFGLKVAIYYQKLARKYCKDNNIKVDKELEYLELGKGGEDYLKDMEVAQRFANENREVMAKEIIKRFFKLDVSRLEKILSVHNYIDTKNNVIRKGAISSLAGEKLLIPLNMKDGIVIGIGKGNKDWNYSAPHGAGRLYSRTQAKKNLSLDEFKKQMKGVWSSCVKGSTLDECPMAYKDKSIVLGSVGDTCEIIDNMKPVYNFKA